MIRSFALLALCVVFAPKLLVAQVINPILFDDHFSSITGASNLASINEALIEYEQQYLPQKFSDEDNYGSRVLGGLYRLTKTIFLENIQDAMVDLVQHEVFGHGARLREFGNDHVTYELHTVPPYGTGSGITYYGDYPNSSDELNAVHIGGVEAEQLLSDEIRSRALERGSINYRESNIYFVGHLSVLLYALRTYDLFSDNSNDIAHFVTQVQYRNPNITLDRIKQLSLASLADPLTLDWFYSFFYTYLRRGETNSPLPFISLGGWKYLPGIRFNLTPFGYEYSLDNNLVESGRVIGIRIGAGSADLGTSVSLDAETHGLWKMGVLTVDGKFGLWRQPELVLSPYFTYSGPSGWLGGGYATVNLACKFAEHAGLMLEAGYKTKGFVQGEALDRGGILRAGVQFYE